MNTIGSTSSRVRVSSPFAVPAQAEGSSAAPTDVCTLGSTAAAAPETRSRGAGRFLALGLTGLAAVSGAMGMASTANAAGWGAPPATSQTVTHSQGGWGAAQPAQPAQNTGGWQQQQTHNGGWQNPAPPPAQSGGWGQSTAPSSNPQTIQHPGGGWQSGTTAPAVAGGVTYSPIGNAFASSGLTLYDAGAQWGNWTQADQQIESQLKMIAENPLTTGGEKSLARMGLQMGQRKDMSYKDSAMARAAVMRVIKDGKLTGSPSQVLARAAMDAYNAVNANDNFDARKTPDADYVLGAGLRAIGSDGTDVDRAVGQLGYDLGNHGGLRYENSVKARLAAMAEIQAPSAGKNVGNRLAIVTHNAFSAANNWADADTFTNDGLTAIKQSPQTSLVQKTLADIALKSRQNGGGDEQGSKMRDQQIQNLRFIQ
jgi:hypothetical protein